MTAEGGRQGQKKPLHRGAVLASVEAHFLYKQLKTAQRLKKYIRSRFVFFSRFFFFFFPGSLI